ncbi:gamma-glutamylcyclotransferase family protein [Persephonella sp.]
MQSTDLKELLFVYGTLKRGGRLHHHLSGARFIGEGYVKGYKMYLVDWYPAVVKGEGIVYGEVFAVSKDVLDVVDKVEDEGIMYRRVKEKVKLEDGAELYCWMYVYNGSTAELEDIPSGKFPV